MEAIGNGTTAIANSGADGTGECHVGTLGTIGTEELQNYLASSVALIR